MYARAPRGAVSYQNLFGRFSAEGDLGEVRGTVPTGVSRSRRATGYGRTTGKFERITDQRTTPAYRLGFGRQKRGHSAAHKDAVRSLLRAGARKNYTVAAARTMPYRRRYPIRRGRPVRRSRSMYKRRRPVKRRLSVRRIKMKRTGIVRKARLGKGSNIAVLPRVWPPTILRGTFERIVDFGGTGNTAINYLNNVCAMSGMQFGSRIDGNGIYYFFTNTDALGTKNSVTAAPPRNWADIVLKYDRVRYLSTRFHLKYETTRPLSTSRKNIHVYYW